MAFAVEINNLTKKFGDFKAVDNLSLKVKIGEIFGLLGPNGAGKTTTIRMLCGLMRPSEGTIRIYEHKMPDERAQAIKIIGYMAQKFGLYEDLTVMENLEFFGKLYGIDGANLKNRIMELLEFLELKEFKDRLAGKLSGGMKQRLALAVALLHKPKLLILDEPTAGVDPPIRRAFWEYLRSLNREGATILITTHYMDEAENCDRIALINRGKLMAIGSPRELKRMAFGGDLVEIKIRGRLNDLKEMKILEEKSDGEFSLLKVLLKDASSELPKLLKLFDEKGLKVISAEPINVTLEEVFIKMVVGS